MSKFKHYAIKTNENFLAKDSRTNCLEIYEDQISADRIVRRSSQEISVVPCYVYTEKEHAVFDEMYELLERAKEVMLNTYDTCDYPADGKTDCDICAKDIDELLAKARGEA